jgi:hypothetical protein
MTEETLDCYREQAFRLEIENMWLETELSIARSEVQSERLIRRCLLVMCVSITIASVVMTAVIATALASPH